MTDARSVVLEFRLERAVCVWSGRMKVRLVSFSLRCGERGVLSLVDRRRKRLTDLN